MLTHEMSLKLNTHVCEMRSTTLKRVYSHNESGVENVVSNDSKGTLGFRWGYMRYGYPPPRAHRPSVQYGTEMETVNDPIGRKRKRNTPFYKVEFLSNILTGDNEEVREDTNWWEPETLPERWLSCMWKQNLWKVTFVHSPSQPEEIRGQYKKWKHKQKYKQNVLVNICLIFPLWSVS